MKDCSWWKGHDWSKWESYVEKFTVIYQWGKLAGKTYPEVEDWQKRYCLKCGIVEKGKI